VIGAETAARGGETARNRGVAEEDSRQLLKMRR